MQSKTGYTATNAIVKTIVRHGIFCHLNMVYVTYNERNAHIQDVNIKICLN